MASQPKSRNAACLAEANARRAASRRSAVFVARPEHLPEETISSFDPTRPTPSELSEHSVFTEARRPRPVLVALPLYRHPEFASRVFASLLTCADELRELEAEVVLYNDSPDDQPLAELLPELLAQAEGRLRCRLEVNAENLGFVGTANRALEEAAARGMDALLLNSDTVLFPGALGEMVRVSRLDPMVGFVNPRSNNATLASLPSQREFRFLAPEPARAAWSALASRLPPVSYAPTAVGFCLLIRWTVLSEFGVFDEIYGRGYNEENDLIMRAGRRGYRAVLANHAFVWHEGGGSFEVDETTNALDESNRDILLQRYPEYGRLIPAYFDSAAHLAERLLGALIPDADGRLKVALDFSSFVPAHNGTFVAGRQLLAAAAEAWRDRFDLSVICSKETYAFHDYAETGVKRCDVHGAEVFAAVFRVGQPYDHNSVERLVTRAAVLGVFMLDTISLDCSQLAEPLVANVWAYTLEHADLIATTSAMTAEQLERRFTIGANVLKVRSLHSLDLEDYRLPQAPVSALPAAPGYIFVVGNHYAHKDVAETANVLAAAYPGRTIVVLVAVETLKAAPAPLADAGRYAPKGLAPFANILRLPAGRLSDEEIGGLYANAAAIVFPSHYEGFGMPLLNALAARRPVFVRPLPVFEELCEALGGDANVHVYLQTRELVERLAEPPAWDEAGAAKGVAADALRAAQDIGRALEQAIRRADYGRIVQRLQVVHFAHDLAGGLVAAAAPGAAREGARAALADLAPKTPRDFVARAVGRAVEATTRRLLALPGAFALLRAAVRLLRGRRPAPA